jgi:hypothetical protein
MPNFQNAGRGPRLVVDNGAATDRGLTDAKIATMTDAELTNIVNNFEAYQGDRVRARWELSRREVNAAYKAGENVFYETDDDLDAAFPLPGDRERAILAEIDRQVERDPTTLTYQMAELNRRWFEFLDACHDVFVVPWVKFFDNLRR